MPNSLPTLDLSKLTAGEVAELAKKEAAAKAETDPLGKQHKELELYILGKQHKELELYIQGLQVKKALANDVVAPEMAKIVEGSEIELIPFPFVTGEYSEDLQALNAKVRVFIMGVEVTDYVASCSWSGTATTSDMNCSASLTLKCPHDLLTITSKNLDASLNNGQVNWVISDDPFYSERVKRDIYDYKRKQNYFERTTNVPRWNLAPNTCIFHHADTIRIFVQIPWTSKDAWLPVFNGYLQSPQMARQTTGEDEITMSCDTLAARLQKARVFNQMNAELLNPKNSTSRLPNNQEFTGITNIDVVDTSLLFADAFGPAANALLDTSLKGLLRFVFYGDLSESNQIFKKDSQRALEKVLADYFNKKDALTALKGKKAALGYDYSNDISKMTTQLEEIKARLVTMPGGEKILDPETGAVLDYTYVKSALRGRRALGFLDPELFITSYTFPISGKKIEITTSTTAPAPATTPAPSTTQTTTFTKQMPVPISVSKISSSYGDQEDFRKRPHRGIDILVHNQAVVAPISGHILAVNLDPREKSGAGIYVRMLGDDGFVHDMFHLSSVSGVKFGQAVPCGAQLGISGNTGAVHKHGASEGYHLHWGVWKWEGSTPDWTGKPIKVTRPDGSEVNPVWWLGSDSVIDATNRIPNQVSTLPSSLDQSTIDWEEEVKGMEQWKKNCLVGWANGIPDPTIDTSAIDFSSFAPTDCLSLASDRKRAYLTHSEVTIIGRNSGFLGQYSPHGQNVAIVLRAPKQGWGYNYGATDDWQIQGASFQANTHTRAQILIELLEKVDYYWWVSGNGDVIFDFPNYEMIPDHYGSKFKNEFEFYGLGVNDTILEDVASLKSTYIFRGNIGFAGARPGELEAISRIYPAIYKLPSVAARNGIEVEEHFWPYITSQEQLKILGALHIRKAIANAFKYTLSGLPPMLYVTPNTPVHLGDIDAYGLVNSTSFHYNAQGNISTDLQFTAIRQRLTEEQLYLKLQSKQSDKVEIEGMAEFLSAWKLKPQLAKNTSEELLNSLQRTAALYGYIFGSGELLIDYTKTYSQNIKLAGGYTVSPSDDRGAYPTGTGGNVTTFQDNPKAPRLISTPEIKVGQAAPETSSDLFITAVAPQPEQLQALKESLVDLSPEDLVPAIVAHGNVTTGLQDRWTMPSFSDVKDLLSKGVGFLNLTSKVLGQVDKTVSGFAQIGNRVTNIANAGFDATASLAAAGKSLQSVMARSHVVDPRMDPVFSSQCAAVISRQVLTHVNKAYDKPLTPAEVHPDIFAYALHLGPKDPALLQILAEHDLRDRSDANTAAIGRALQARMWKMGGYTKRDLDYVDAFQNMKKQAAKRGLHN